mgnify:CR=1 FL=1
MKRLKRHQKYNNTKVTIDEILFDSKKEAHMYGTLKRWVKEGKIKDFQLKPLFELIPRMELMKKGKLRVNRPCTYTPDFMFFDIDQNRTRVLDAKGHRDSTYLVKKKLFDWIHKDKLYIEETL